MFTDMVGYSSLSQKNETLSLELLEEHRSILRSYLPSFGGSEIKTMGDSFLVEFASAQAAVECACEIQKALHKLNEDRTEDRKILLRIGIHLGDIIHKDRDIYGDAVNVASRIEPLSTHGGICVSGEVYAQVRNKISFPLANMGSRELKNIHVPVTVYQVVLPWENESEVRARARLIESPIANKRRIAVLPFSNISPNPSDEYFADGMTEELIAAVSKISGLRVIARTSVMRYKGEKGKSIHDIGLELGVGTILEGSARKSGNNLRINAQLIDVMTSEQVWSGSYDRKLEDVFSIQTEISKKIVSCLKIKISQIEKRQLSRKSTDVIEAYTLYLKGRYHWAKRTEEDLKKAIFYFKRALDKDQSYALANCGLADSYALLALFEFSAPNEAFPKARANAEQALKIDPNLAEAHVSLGLVLFQYEYSWNAAEKEFKRAIELNPNYPSSHQFFADYLKAMGRFDEALSEMKRALELDPLSLPINTGIGHVLYLSRQYDLAIEQYLKALELDPKFVQAHLWFGRPYLEKGMFSEAINEVKRAVELSGESTISLAVLGHAYASAGRMNQALDIVKKLKERAKQRYLPSYWIALIYTGLKDRDAAFEWLKRAFQERSSWLVWIKVEPRYDVLRSDERFVSLMKKMNIQGDHS
jgi:adenylate cyclase